MSLALAALCCAKQELHLVDLTPDREARIIKAMPQLVIGGGGFGCCAVVDVVDSGQQAAGVQQQPDVLQQQPQQRMVLKLSAQGELCLRLPKLLPPTMRQFSREAATLRMLSDSGFVAKFGAFVLLLLSVHPGSYVDAGQPGASEARDSSRTQAQDSARKAASKACPADCMGYADVPRGDHATEQQLASRLHHAQQLISGHVLNAS